MFEKAFLEKFTAKNVEKYFLFFNAIRKITKVSDSKNKISVKKSDLGNSLKQK